MSPAGVTEFGEWIYRNCCMAGTMQRRETNYNMNYALLLECYRSGQITEAQWQEHLKDEIFAAWLKRRS